MTYNIIKTENYLLVVDDSEIKEGDWCLANGVTYNNTVVKYLKIPCPPSYVSNLSILKKIIAHLPLNSPTLYGVHLLPPLEQEDDVEKLAKEYSVDTSKIEPTGAEEFGKYWGFKEGYNKAKEKYKWTDEDVIKIVEKSRETGLTAEYLLLTMSQPKYPIGFECETITMNKGYTDKKDYPYKECQIPKTTSNPQGQTTWIGNYIY